MVNKRIVLDMVAAVNEHGMTMKEVANKLGLNMQEVKSWLKLDTEPPKSTIEHVMNFLKNPEAEIPVKEEEAPKMAEPSRKTPKVPKEEGLPRKEVSEVVPETTSKNTKKAAGETLEVAPTTTKKAKGPMSEKEKVTTGNPNEKKQFFRNETATLIRSVINAKKTDSIMANSVAEAGKFLSDRIAKDVKSLLCIMQDTTMEAFKKPDPLPEKIQKLLDAAAGASNEGLELATTILKKFSK